MPPRTYRKSPRLRGFDYAGPLAAHVVMVTRSRRRLFDVHDTAQTTIGLLSDMASRYAATVHAYALMPDHLHLLVEIPEGVSLPEVVRWFKQMSGYALKQVSGEAWQVSYYDHVLRKEESLEDVARYIWNNPVTDGLVEDWMEYPYSGPREMMVAYGGGSQV